MNRPEIFKYTDLKEFLRDSYQEKRKANPRWTLGAWAKKMGFSGSSSLANILRGDRSPGPNAQKLLIKYFEFNSHEIIFFLGLIHLEKIDLNSKCTLNDFRKVLSPDPTIAQLPDKTKPSQ